MNTLKELNLISVLNNLEDEKLDKILDKTNKLKLINMISSKKCNNCNNKLSSHYKCEKCHNFVCYSFYTGVDNNMICLDCVYIDKIYLYDNTIYVGKYGFIRCHIYYNLPEKYENSRYKKIMISYEELVEIMKNNKK